MAKLRGPDSYFENGNSGGRQAAPVTNESASANEVPVQVPAGVPEPVSAATAEAPVSEVSAANPADSKKPESSVEEDILVLDPNKLIQLPSGERITFAEFNSRQMKHEKYIAGMTELDKQKKQVATKAQDISVKETIADTVLKSQRLALVTKYMNDGLSEEQAFQKAGIGVAENTHTGPTVMVEGIRIPAPPTDDLESDEYANWYNSHYKGALAKSQVNPEIKALTDRLAALEAERSKEIEIGTRYEQTAAANQDVLDTWVGHLKQITGIDYVALPQEEKVATEQKVLEALLARGIDPRPNGNLGLRPISQQEVYDAVFQSHSVPVNPYFRVSEKEKIQLTKPRTTTNPIVGSPAGTQSSPGTRSPNDRFNTGIDRNLAKYDFKVKD